MQGKKAKAAPLPYRAAVPLHDNIRPSSGIAQPDQRHTSSELVTICSLLRIFQIVRSERLMLYF